MIIIQTTTTERRTYVEGATPQQQKELAAAGYSYDRLARQYRKTETKTDVIDNDGVVSRSAA